MLCLIYINPLNTAGVHSLIAREAMVQKVNYIFFQFDQYMMLKTCYGRYVLFVVLVLAPTQKYRLWC